MLMRLRDGIGTGLRLFQVEGRDKAAFRSGSGLKDECIDKTDDRNHCAILCMCVHVCSSLRSPPPGCACRQAAQAVVVQALELVNAAVGEGRAWINANTV